MENRHLRALSARHINGSQITVELVAWAKQHIEWTLMDGATAEPNGVLMIIVDTDGRAAMSVGPYTKLHAVDTATLVKRATLSRREANRTGVAPETLWMVSSKQLIVAANEDEQLSGAASLIVDLAQARHINVVFNGNVADAYDAEGAFLASDEHGIVPATDHTDMISKMFAKDYERLLLVTRRSDSGLQSLQ